MWDAAVLGFVYHQEGALPLDAELITSGGTEGRGGGWL